METWQVRVCPFEVKSDWTIRIHTGMKMGLWPWNPAFISSAPAQHKRFKTVETNEATVAAAGTCCESQFFSEQSARAIQSLHVNLESKLSLLWDMEAVRINKLYRTSQPKLQCLSNMMEKKKKHNGEGGRCALTVRKEQSHQLTFNIIWNVLELEETMAGLITLGVCHLLLESNFPKKRASSLGMSHANQASQPDGEGLTRKIDEDARDVEEASSWMTNTKSCGVINAMPLRLPSSGG